MEKQLTKDEELALMRVLKKRIDQRIKDIEGDAKDRLLASYEEDGYDRRPVKVNGEPIGSIAISYSAAKPVIDPFAQTKALDYLEGCGLTERAPKKGWEERFAQCGSDVIDCETGEVVDFLLWEPKRPKCVRTTIKEEEAVKALRPMLVGESVAALMGGDGVE